MNKGITIYGTPSRRYKKALLLLHGVLSELGLDIPILEENNFLTILHDQVQVIPSVKVQNSIISFGEEREIDESMHLVRTHILEQFTPNLLEIQ